AAGENRLVRVKLAALEVRRRAVIAASAAAGPTADVRFEDAIDEERGGTFVEPCSAAVIGGVVLEDAALDDRRGIAAVEAAAHAVRVRNRVESAGNGKDLEPRTVPHIPAGEYRAGTFAIHDDARGIGTIACDGDAIRQRNPMLPVRAAGD